MRSHTWTLINSRWQQRARTSLKRSELSSRDESRNIPVVDAPLRTSTFWDLPRIKRPQPSVSRCALGSPKQRVLTAPESQTAMDASWRLDYVSLSVQI